MKLDKTQQARLGPTGETCFGCQQKVIKDYCRTCDEFLFVCGCQDADILKHKTHRKYITGFKCQRCSCPGGCTCCTPERCMCSDNGVELDT